jgi:hypothetical protein
VLSQLSYVPEVRQKPQKATFCRAELLCDFPQLSAIVNNCPVVCR